MGFIPLTACNSLVYLIQQIVQTQPNQFEMFKLCPFLNMINFELKNINEKNNHNNNNKNKFEFNQMSSSAPSASKINQN